MLLSLALVRRTRIVGGELVFAHLDLDPRGPTPLVADKVVQLARVSLEATMTVGNGGTLRGKRESSTCSTRSVGSRL